MLLRDPLRGPLVLLAGVVLVMAAVFYFQFGMGLRPCPLCYTQRIPYYAGGAGLLLAALLHGRVPILHRLLLGLVGVGFLIGAGIAAYHVGVEQQWWTGPTSCSGGLPTSGSAADAVARLMAAPVVRCDEVAWSLFGISMAGYNVLLSLGLAAGAIGAAIMTGRGRAAKEDG